MTTPAGSASARFKARLAGVFYSITFLAGGFALFDRSGLGIAAGVIAGLSYVAVTLILGAFVRKTHAGGIQQQVGVFVKQCKNPRRDCVGRIHHDCR